MNKLSVTLVLVLSLACLSGGIAIPYSDLKGYAAIITGTSGALFTIMGIWVAFLYPSISDSLKSPNVIPADFSVNGEETKRLKTVVVVIVVSAVVLISSLFLFLISSLLDYEITTVVGRVVNQCVTLFALFMTLCLVFCIYKVILVSLALVDLFEHGERKRKSDRNA